MSTLVLFDIDGTLVDTAGAGRDAVADALVAVMGTTGPIDEYRFDGKTDPQIIVELMRLAGHPHAESAAHLQAVCDAYLERLEGTLAARAGGRIRVCPGVPELLDALEAHPSVVLGLLTGNLAAGAERKLEAAGIGFARFRIGAFGSDDADRAALPAIAARRAAAVMRRAPHGAEIVIVGDTPADMTCGRGVGARAIGVGTGRHPAEELRGLGAHAAFETLADTDAVLRAILP